MIPFLNPPGLNELKEVMSSAKSMKMATEQIKNIATENNSDNKFKENMKSTNNKSTDNSLNLHFDAVIRIIKEGILKKKSPWFHYNTRKVILDTTPKIEYVDPISGAVKVRN